MSVAEFLSPERVTVSSEAEGLVRSKRDALERLSELLVRGDPAVSKEQVLSVLEAREKLQSTGVGGGVAVPHGSVEELSRQVAALLICPSAIPFESIDGEPVHIVFGLVGPKGAPAQHLKILARVSRLLRNQAFRGKLIGSPSGEAAFDLVRATERSDA